MILHEISRQAPFDLMISLSSQPRQQNHHQHSKPQQRLPKAPHSPIASLDCFTRISVSWHSMSADQSQSQPAEAEASIPIPPGVSLQPRAERAARRIHKALGVYPWEIVPESPPKGWAINLVEDLALVTEHVARSTDATLDDLRDELRKSISRDRKPSYAGRLMAQDIQAAKKRFVRGHRESTSREQGGIKATQHERRGVASIPPTPSQSREAELTVEGSEEDDPSSITVASGAPTSPPLPRNIKTLKRVAHQLSSSPPEKRGRASSPDGSRLSAAQSLMLFSSPMASFTMANSARAGNTVSDM